MKSYTAAFYPTIDDYTYLKVYFALIKGLIVFVVNVAYSLLNTLASTKLYANVSVIAYIEGTYYQTSWRSWNIHQFGVTYHVPARYI
jgi:hypothetical protein